MIDEMTNSVLMGYVLDSEDSTELEIELVQRLGDALGEIDLLMKDLAQSLQVRYSEAQERDLDDNEKMQDRIDALLAQVPA